MAPLALGLIAGLLLAFLLVNRDHEAANHQSLVRAEAVDHILDRMIARIGGLGRHGLSTGLDPSDAAALDADVRRIDGLGGDASITVIRRDGLVMYSDDPGRTGLNLELSPAERSALASADGFPVSTSGQRAAAGPKYIGLPAGAGQPAALLEIDEAGDEALPATLLTWRQYLLVGGLAIFVWLALQPLASRAARVRSASLYRARPLTVRAITRGIPRGEFELHYQPQIDAQTGLPIAVEALLRWRRNGELVMPGAYLPDAEASGVIIPLTNHVLALAVAQAGEWHRNGESIRVAVNLSSASLTDLRVVDRIRRLLIEHDVPPNLLTVEVTETAVLDEPEQARAVLDAVAALGVDVSVDDFGTGYSSLLWLRLFPVAEVKVDRTFVSSIQEDGEAFVSGVIRMGHDLGLRVVAEGIEDRPTLSRLQELGCDVAQGSLFAKAMPPQEIPGWFENAAKDPWAPSREEIAIGTDAASLDEARVAIERTATALGYSDDDIWDLKFAATEALSNAIDHGQPAPDGLVHLRVGSANGEILVEVWGGAKGGGEKNGSNGGRGIAIMSALVDDVELSRHAGRTVVRLSKRSKSGPAADTNGSRPGQEQDRRS